MVLFSIKLPRQSFSESTFTNLTSFSSSFYNISNFSFSSTWFQSVSTLSLSFYTFLYLYNVFYIDNFIFYSVIYTIVNVYLLTTKFTSIIIESRVVVSKFFVYIVQNRRDEVSCLFLLFNIATVLKIFFSFSSFISNQYVRINVFRIYFIID